MYAIAAAVLITVVAVTAWALVVARDQVLPQLLGFWQQPWGKQVYFDFYGLEVILALWMLEDASNGGSLGAAIASIVAMPVFGAMSAAAYWLVR